MALAIQYILYFIFYFTIRKIKNRSEEHTSELKSLAYLVCRLLLEKKKKKTTVAAALDKFLENEEILQPTAELAGRKTAEVGLQQTIISNYVKYTSQALDDITESFI